MSKDSIQKADQFLKICGQFQLGFLPTEQPHPKTNGLSLMANDNLKQAIYLLKELDLDCLAKIKNKYNEINQLKDDINKTIENGGRIFLCGCGATGRLSLALERIYREVFVDSNHVISFMAGGDVALISSIEEFEDMPSYGARQLQDLAFSDRDLLIASTEGGETPWVIGATEKASELSKFKPYFLYCNPDDILIQNIERSRNVLKNSNIKKINLSCDQMALTGSTRMQASTILMFSIGLALIHRQKSDQEISELFNNFFEFYKQEEVTLPSQYTKAEADLYLNKKYIIYNCDDHLAISVLTDTTERSPTFSLAPFENQLSEEIIPSLCYLSLYQINSNEQAWEYLLGRTPRIIDWEETKLKTSLSRLLGHDISKKIISLRESYLANSQEEFKINHFQDHIEFRFQNQIFSMKIFNNDHLFAHMQLKMALNIHSTLIMGRLDRFHSNIMTWVKSSNNKLVDRTARNVDYLLKQENIHKSYQEIIYKIFELKETTKIGEPLVLKVVAALK